MKKVLSLLLATVMLFNLTACGKNETYTTEQVKEIVAPYMRDLRLPTLTQKWSLCGKQLLKHFICLEMWQERLLLSLSLPMMSRKKRA